MTIVISVVGLAARFAGALLTTALGWASNLLFGRVPRSHQSFVLLMLAGSLLWLALLVCAIVPTIADVLLDLTPHPPLVDRSIVRGAVLVGLVSLPLGVGLAGYLVPADAERPSRLAIPFEILRGYLLTPVLAGVMLFLAAVGMARKARSLRHGWSDTHIPIVAKPDGYDRLVIDLQRALLAAGVRVEAGDAPAVLSLPGWVLTKIAGANVRKLRPDRLVHLKGPRLRVGVYPSDIAISGPSPERERARAAILSRLATTAAHLTTSAEAQAFEDRLEAIARREPGVARAAASVTTDFRAIDEALLDLKVPAEEWETLYRLRLQIERDILAGVKPGTAFPGDGAVEPALSPRITGPIAGSVEREPSR